MSVMASPEAAVAILRARDEDSFLLMRRSEHPHDPWSGHWSFPGGRREPSDPDLRHTALRELYEECNIRLSPECLVHELAPVIARRRTPPFLLVAPFVFAVENQLPTVLDPEEAVESTWVSTKYWRTPEMHLLRSVPGMPEHWLFPAVDLNGVPVWGFTYRLVMDWLGLLSHRSQNEATGLHTAERILEFLSSNGVTLKQSWKTVGTARSGAEAQVSASAKVAGIIPVERAMAYLTQPDSSFPAVNAIELQPNFVRVVGLQFEEYLITAI